MPARGSGINIDVKVDVAPATDEFKRARRDVNARTRDGLKKAGEKAALPEAKRRAGSLAVGGTRIATTLVVRATSRDAYLTSSMRGIKGRAVGLMEFGGTVKTTIVPKRGKALTIGGDFVAHVTTPRRYRPRLFLTSAVNARQPEIATAVRDEILKAFDGFDTA